MIDPVEKSFEVEVNNDAVAFGNVALRLGYRLVGGASRTEAVAVLGERWIPTLLQDLQQRLLDQSVDDTRHAEFSDPAIGLRYLDPSDRLWPIGSCEQLGSYVWPMLTQVALGAINGHPINARSSFVAPDALPRAYEVLSLAHLLHQVRRCSRLSGSAAATTSSALGSPAIRDSGFTPV